MAFFRRHFTQSFRKMWKLYKIFLVPTLDMGVRIGMCRDIEKLDTAEMKYLRSFAGCMIYECKTIK